jgi:hypothetical protein
MKCTKITEKQIFFQQKMEKFKVSLKQELANFVYKYGQKLKSLLFQHMRKQVQRKATKVQGNILHQHTTLTVTLGKKIKNQYGPAQNSNKGKPVEKPNLPNYAHGNKHTISLLMILKLFITEGPK